MTVASLKIAHVSDSPLAIVQATDGDSLQEIPLLLCVGVRPVPPLMMDTLGIPITVFSWGIPITVFSWGIPITVFSCPRSGDGGFHSPDLSRVSGFSFPSIVEIIRLSATTDVAEAIPQQERFARHIKDGKACHTLLHTLNKFERVSDSPTQGKELNAIPDILDFLRNKVPDSRYVPLSFKDSAALERSMRSMLEIHSFLTWSVVAFIRSLHDRNLLPKGDQIISRLKKSFSTACGNLASGLSSSAAFVTLKRRQLLLSHVVPSVSDAQTWKLLSDPFFSKQAPSFPVLLWRLLALPPGTCPHLRLTWNLRPPRLPHVARAILALRLLELLLDLWLPIHRRSGLLPLTGLSLVRRAIRASGRSLPDPTRSGLVFGGGSLVPHRRSAAA